MSDIPQDAAPKPGWGGARRGSGPKPRRNRPKANTALTNLPPAIEPQQSLNLQPSELARVQGTYEALIAASKTMAQEAKKRSRKASPFKIPAFPPRAMPEDKSLHMAMDDSMNWATSQWVANSPYGLSQEGLLFLGYPYLAELAQRPEYRTFAETVATEMTRKWITFSGVADPREDGGGDTKVDPEVEVKIRELKDFLDHLQCRDRYAEQARNDGLFGRSHLYHDFGDVSDEELRTPIGNGRDVWTEHKVGKGSLKRLATIEPVWCYPTTYNATFPLSSDWYDPQVWYVMGQQIHRSRLPLFVGRPVPDLLKPAYSFGGLAMTQMAKPYVDIWLTTRQSVADMIHSFSVMVLMTDLATMMQPQNAVNLLLRLQLFNEMRDNQGVFAVNKATEDMKNISAPISGLSELQAQAQEHMMSVARIPAVKFTGMQPHGLNASSEGEIRTFYDTISAYQNSFFRPNLTTTIDLAQITLWGKRDDRIKWEFAPLWELTEKEKGEKRKADAETGGIHIDKGVISPAEERARIANDPDGVYHDLDPDDVPDLAAEEEEGLEPEGGRPDPKAEGEPKPDNDNGGGGANDAAIPFAVDDAGWNENDHPRAQNGQFGSGGGGGKQKLQAPQYGMVNGKLTASHGGESPAPKRTSNIGAPIDTSKMEKVGKQMGSNPGGVFKDESGKKFYVKQGQTKDHVRNEMIAAALYDLAGTPTLQYRPVEGGTHIATEMSKLDKDNVSKMTPAEKREASRDFAVHAWLGNWDAVGLGGDNLGTVGGVPTALDLGGALEYRAQGGPKGKAFGEKVGELDTLRDAKMNPDAAGVFGQMTPADLRESARFVTEIPDAKIRAAVEKMGGSNSLADKLIARKEDIAQRAKFFGAEGDPSKPDGTMVVPIGEGTPLKTLNGVKFGKWTPPEDWSTVEGQAQIEEPAFDAKGKQPASGVIIREPDGRVWLVQPKGGYGGYDGTFPKGRVDEGLSMQANAIKEAYEESGLKVRITGHAGDADGDVTRTRYYFAEREGGDPSEHEDETEGVVLTPKAKADGFLNRRRDREVLAQDEAPFEEGKHPRDADGKFASGAGGGGSSAKVESDPKKQATQKLIGDLFAKYIDGDNPLGGKESDIPAIMTASEAKMAKEAYGSVANAVKAYKESQGDLPGLPTVEKTVMPSIKKALEFMHHGGPPLTKADEDALADYYGSTEKGMESLEALPKEAVETITGKTSGGAINAAAKALYEEQHGKGSWDKEGSDLQKAEAKLQAAVENGDAVTSKDAYDALTAKETHALAADYGSLKEAFVQNFGQEEADALSAQMQEEQAGLEKPDDDPEHGEGAKEAAVPEADPTQLEAGGKPKKTAFGGLWKTKPGLSAEREVLFNAGNVLGKATNAGSSYRQMLGHMIKKLDGTKGNEDIVSQLKAKLGEAYNLAGEKALAQYKELAAAGKTVEAGKFHKAAGEAFSKAKEFGGAGKPGAPVEEPKAPKQDDKASVKKFSPTFAKVFGMLPDTGNDLSNGENVLVAASANDGSAEAAEVMMTPAQIAAVKGQHGSIANAFKKLKGKPLTQPGAKAVPKVDPKSIPAATEQEMEKAKKNVALQLQYVPGADTVQSAPGKQEAQKLVEAFNAKYADKTLTKPQDLSQKVHDFKMLGAQMAVIAKVEKSKAAEWQAQQQAEAKQKAEAEKAKQAAQAKANAEKNKHVMAALGINEQEADGFNALVQMVGGNQKDVIESFKQYEDKATKLGYPIGGFEAALIMNYSDGGYSQVNKALRSGSVTTAQHVYTKMVNKALQKMPRFEGQLQRGTHLTAEQQALYLAGNVVEERALTSTSVSNPFGGNTHFKIKAIGKRAAHIKKLSHYPSEDEVLFSARTFFKVTKVEGTPGGKMVVHMEEMDD